MSDGCNSNTVLKCQVKYISCYDTVARRPLVVHRSRIDTQALTTEAVADRSKAFYTLLLECVDDFVQMGAGMLRSMFSPPLLDIEISFLSKYNIRIRRKSGSAQSIPSWHPQGQDLH